MIVGLDFETETDEHGNAKPLLCCLNGDNYERTFELQVKEHYKEFIYTLLLSEDKYVVFNASFDVEIIIIMLLKNGFKFLKNEDTPAHKTMKLIMGQKIYSLTTYFEFKDKIYKSEFVDLGNIIVGANLKDIAKKFTHLEKGDFEVSKNDWEVFKEYCMLDAKITRLAYENVIKQLGIETLTIGSAAFRIMLEMGLNAKTHKGRFKLFKRLLGDNTLEEDKHLRKWYAGGLGWSSTDERTEVNIDSWDLISAYPAESIGSIPTTRNSLKLKGYHAPDEKYPFAFIHLKVTGQVKEGRVPVLPSRNIYGDSNIYLYDDKDVYIIQEYNKKSEYEFWLENMEIENISYEETILMKEASMNPIKPFMEHFYHLKNTTTGIEREMNKRLLNALTGKLGTNPTKDNTSYKIDENNKLIKDESEQVIIDVYVTHVVSIITSRVRTKLYEIDSKIRDKVRFRMYATDSVKHSSLEKDIIERGSEWGEWDIEHKNTEFIFLGLKAYIFDANNKQGKREVMCAGISREYKKKITNEQFYAKTLVPSLISARAGNGRIIYEGLKRITNPIKKPRRRSEINEI